MNMDRARAIGAEAAALVWVALHEQGGGRPISAWKYVARHRLEKLRIGLRYGLGLPLTESEASTLHYDAEGLAHMAVLASIDITGTMATALDRFEPHPDLEGYIAEGIDRVRSKWSGNGDMVGEAEDWAIELAVEYAERDGVTFTEID